MPWTSPPSHQGSPALDEEPGDLSHHIAAGAPLHGGGEVSFKIWQRESWLRLLAWKMLSSLPTTLSHVMGLQTMDPYHVKNNMEPGPGEVGARSPRHQRSSAAVSSQLLLAPNPKDRMLEREQRDGRQDLEEVLLPVQSKASGAIRDRRAGRSEPPPAPSALCAHERKSRVCICLRHSIAQAPTARVCKASSETVKYNEV